MATKYDLATDSSMGLEEGSCCPFCLGILDCAQEGDFCKACDRMLSLCPGCNRLLKFEGCRNFNYKEFVNVSDCDDIFQTLWYCKFCKEYYTGTSD